MSALRATGAFNGDDRMKPSKFGITVTATMKHAALYAACQKMRQLFPGKAGSRGNGQSLLARHLGVTPQTLGRWVNLRGCPPTTVDESEGRYPKAPWLNKWTKERIEEVEKKLFDLTGKTLPELFPKELRENAEFLAQTKSVKVTRDVDIRALRYDPSNRLLLPSPCDVVAERLDAQELKLQIERSLKSLSYREREILKYRYGLDGVGFSYSLKEVAAIFEVVPERVRQIEAKAIRKLQQPHRARELMRFI